MRSIPPPRIVAWKCCSAPAVFQLSAANNSTSEAVIVGIRSAVQTAGYRANLNALSLSIGSIEGTGFSRQSFDGKPSTTDNVVELPSGTLEGIRGGPLHIRARELLLFSDGRMIATARYLVWQCVPL